jgi:predicted outer membrane protein
LARLDPITISHAYQFEETVMLKNFTFALSLATIMAAAAVAQTATQPAQQPGQQPGQQPRQGAAAGQQQPGDQTGSLDQEIAACLALGNQEEIALANFASSRAKHDRVKEFAQMMQRDHSQALQRLNEIAPQLASMNLQLQAGAPGQGGQFGQDQQGQTAINQQPGQARPDRPQQGQGAQQAGGQQPGGQGVQQASATQPAGGAINSQSLALARAVAEKCLALTQRELEEAGDDFDMAYIGQQCVAHTQMLAKLQASEQFASGELRSFIQEAQQTVQTHQQHAKDLKKELKNQAGSGNQAAPRQGEPRR